MVMEPRIRVPAYRMNSSPSELRVGLVKKTGARGATRLNLTRQTGGCWARAVLLFHRQNMDGLDHELNGVPHFQSQILH